MSSRKKKSEEQRKLEKEKQAYAEQLRKKLQEMSDGDCCDPKANT